jgi:hypothetical protein
MLLERFDMRGSSSVRSGLIAISLFSAFAASLAQAQTAVWLGGGTDDTYTNPTNWQGGVAPNNSGSYTIQLSFSNDLIAVNTAANVAGSRCRPARHGRPPQAATTGSSRATPG